MPRRFSKQAMAVQFTVRIMVETALVFGVVILLSVSGSAQSGSERQDLTTQAVPYSLPVELPPTKTSPKEDPAAPYTPLVLSLIHQLEPSNPPTPEEIRNASVFLSTVDGTNGTCHNLANVVSRTATTPRILPLCFSDGLGISALVGPNVGKTTGLTSLLALAATFDTKLANAMGQIEGREGRNLMVTGLLGPQADTDVLVNWGRGHHTPGEDPYLNGVISAAQINGIQGQGLMSQVKHFAGYSGMAESKSEDLQDQALHELLLPPYEMALKDGGASSIMCSYSKVHDPSTYLAHTIDLLTQPSPFPGGSIKTWPLNEIHYACENPLIVTYILRNLWGSKVFVASDYGAVHSSSGFLQGDDREDPTSTYQGETNPFGMIYNPYGPAVDLGIDETSSNCADLSGNPVACTQPGAVHVAGIPGAGCPPKGCGVANAVIQGIVPIAVFNQALARVLYQEERFGMIGCDNGSTDCKNPGGIDGDRSGTAPLPEGAMQGKPMLGTKYGDAAILERVAEEAGVLFKNNDQALPITNAKLQGGIAISGPGAEYLIANPNNEGATGFADRNAVSPLQQLRALSANPSAFTYTPAGSPTGQAVPCSVLAYASGTAPSSPPAAPCGPSSGLQRSVGTTPASLKVDRVDSSLDYTAVSKQGQLQGGKLYRWDGWIYVPAQDTYAFRVQHSSAVPDGKVKFSIDGTESTLTEAISFYQGQYYGNMSVVVSPTNAGYVEKGLRNRQCAVSKDPIPSTLSGPPPAPVIPCTQTPQVGWHKVSLILDTTDLAPSPAVSFRFAFSRTQGDTADAAAEAKGKAMAVVFVNDQGRNVAEHFKAPADFEISSLQPDQIQLIQAVAASNPNTVVVLNTGTPIVVKEWIDNPNVKAVLNMWHAGQEGGTATARLLLGQANPSGHTTITWPVNHTDNIVSYKQPQGLYAGDTPGKHPERLNGAAGGSSIETQGIYSGYRYYDKLKIPVQFPFGFGLSYTTFRYANLKLAPKPDGSVDVEFDASNTGALPGSAVPQVYVGPGPEVTGVQQAVRALRGFDRVTLNPGETKHIAIALDKRSFQYWSEAQQAWVTNAGNRKIFVGDADQESNLNLSASINIPLDKK